MFKVSGVTVDFEQIKKQDVNVLNINDLESENTSYYIIIYYYYKNVF